MAKSHPNSFQRALPNKDLFRGSARSSLLWGALGSILFGSLLFNAYLIVGLLISGGELELAFHEAERFTALTGERLLGLPNAEEQSSLPRAIQFENRGLLPIVWSSSDMPWGGLLAMAYRRLGWLHENGTALALLVLVLIGLSVGRNLVLSRSRTLSLRAAMEVVSRLRRAVHRQTLRLGPSNLEDSECSYALDLFTAEMERVRDGVFEWIYRLARNPLTLLFVGMLALAVHWLLALQCLIPLAACWFLVRRERQRFAAVRRLAEDRARLELQRLAAGLRKTRLVRGFGREAIEHEQFQENLVRYRERISAIKQGEGLSWRMIHLLVLLCLTIVLFLVAGKTLLPPGDPNLLSVSEVLLLLMAFACLYRPLQELWHLPSTRAAASQAADRIYRYLDQIPEVGQAVGAKFLHPLQKAVQFESVSYSLSSQKKILDRLDLKIPAGEVTAVVSLDSLAARAMTYLLPRFIEPQSGRVLIDGEDIAWVTLESLRAEIIYVSGDDPYFDDTVFNNISCGNTDYKLQDVTLAAKETHAHNFIQRLPQGYETLLGEHALEPDAGQNFRLALARAVLRNPALLIVEEPTQPLDEDTKSLLDDAYNRIVRERT